jgi:uncharacterized Zn finger protein (UPF0148 family)
MSNDFDKEAEREKLREKLSDDGEKREHTQRMSELLLKGATMTNRHCDDCGDPIFRHDGREFCPSCHTVDAADVQAAEDERAEAAASGAPGASGTPGATEATGSPESAQTAQPPETGAHSEPDGPDVHASRDGSVAGGGSPAPSTDSPTEPSDAPSGGAPSPAGAPPASSARAPTDAGAGSVADARASLIRTLGRFAAAAEETDDPRRARDHLRAAREAAEALAALDR